MAAEALKDKLVGRVSRDSTAIETRERPVNRKKDAETQPPPKEAGTAQERRGADQRVYLR